ncbi:MAG: DNA-3-methyladenine glycosylase 2 family protein [Acidobacteria bacterium]|nr:DNA-3-methyladenine glycosylase 2 family protein [Acidobacteriota bacterium]MBK9708689.1 DNA-3-methyladenine glycosylase 2 family protein [Acidobacteriota bacterium]
MDFSTRQLDRRTLLRAVKVLGAQDQDLGKIVSLYGPPPLWKREEGFHTLIHIILEQQVSLASAKAAYERLVEALRVLTPENFLNLDDEELKTIGFSRQKTRYGRNLAEAVIQGALDPESLGMLEDAEVRSRLMSLKGIGAWTADIYLLMALGRPDIWPTGDLALAVAVQQLKQMSHRPTTQALADLSEDWRPWRAVAARILWHYYLSVTPRKST